jgi:hypothetical protein
MGSIRTVSISLAMAVALAAAPAAHAAIVVLGFEGVNPTYPSATSAQILNFYDGGTSSAATSGTNFGISFASNAVAVCLNKLGGSCSNASRGGLSVTSARAALGIDTGTSTYLDFASAYSGQIAFSYQVAPGFSATIQAFSGLGGTGAALTGPLALFNTNPGGCPTYNASLCTLGPGGLGAVVGAQSIVFTGLAHKFVFDDLTFGAGNDPLPPPAFVRSDTPEPAAWTLMILGFGGVGAALRRRRTVQAF